MKTARKNTQDCLTSNQHYAAINAKFEKRSKLLRRFGFKYIATEFGAVFARQRYGKNQYFQASFLQLADKRTWLDTLQRNLIRSF